MNRQETIERIFGTAKENHGFRYTQMYGKARMKMKVGLTYACINLKKLAGILAKKHGKDPHKELKHAARTLLKHFKCQFRKIALSPAA